MRRVVLRAAAVLAVAGACSARPGNAAAPSARVVVETAAGARHPVRVEVARTDPERARGLMHREKLDDDAGMLFLFSESEEHAFWMKNTLIPLDMLFIAEDGAVVGIVERATPQTTSLRTVGLPSRFVLEVNGGWCAARGVKKGDRVRFENVPRF
ncbi:MAG: DUF192 domain-containing protein [Anaeromyxobacter sp.]